MKTNATTSGYTLNETRVERNGQQGIGLVRLYLQELIAMLESDSAAIEMHFETKKVQLNYYLIITQSDEIYDIKSSDDIPFGIIFPLN